MTQVMTEILRPIPISGFDRIEAAGRLLEEAPPEETLRWAFEEFQGGVTIPTGFGAEGVVLIDIAIRINPDADIFFLDTSFLFPETYALRRQLEERFQIEIRGFQTDITPEQQEREFGAMLWSTDPDLCCRLRKLEPLKDALRGRDAWITAIRRDQTLERSSARVVEWDHQWQLVKINPLVRWSKQQVWDYIAKHNLPYNPLHDQGYPSIGCSHCTQPVLLGGLERAGRWPGRAKRECGMHGPAQPTAFILRSEELHPKDTA